MMITKKRLIWALCVLILSIAAGELSARYYFGLGTPPLLVTDPDVEYMFKPDQDVYRFGNRIIINHYGMRTTPFASHPSSDSLRIMVFGDSVINGGNLTDHNDLATTRVQNKLSDVYGNEVVVGNISAGSWGPGNWLAYANKYGFFASDVVILVISSHDYADNPNFKPLNPNTHPSEKPFSALEEGITRYLPRYVPRISTEEKKHENEQLKEPSSEEIKKGLADLKGFLTLAKSRSKQVVVLQHWEKAEIESGFAKLGNRQIREVCKSLGVPAVQLMPYFLKSLQGGLNPYRDNIHPNRVGQQLISEVMFDILSHPNTLK